jgi:DedD protein
VAEAAKEAPPEVAAEPERTTSVVTPRAARPLTVPATPRAAVMKPAEPVTTPRKPAPAAAIARTPPPQSPLVRHAPASRPLTRTGEPTRQFVVQMGVFNNLANAEEFRAKLEQAGLPAQIEARVQVGPFSTRQEADAAREKLRALGLETGILTAIKR